jgi:hypothetical protein
VAGKLTLRQGLRRGGQRAVIHLLKAGVEVLRGVEGFFEELSAAARPGSRDRDESAPRPRRIPVD